VKKADWEPPNFYEDKRPFPKLLTEGSRAWKEKRSKRLARRKNDHWKLLAERGRENAVGV